MFWFVFAWGASATVAAAVGPAAGAGLAPAVRAPGDWLSRHRDLGPRYLAEGTSNSAATQLRNYGVGLILGLAAVGYVQAATTLMGPFMVIFLGMGLVAVPEAARILRRSPRHLPLFCALIGLGLAVAGLAWGVCSSDGAARGASGTGCWPGIWRPAYPLMLPLTVSVMGQCLTAGAGAGLHALGAARRSLSAMLLASAIFLLCSIAGAFVGGTVGIMQGAALATWISALVWWWQFRAALRGSSDRGQQRRAPVAQPATTQPATVLQAPSAEVPSAGNR